MDPADGGQPNRDGLGAGNRAGRRGFGAAPGDRRRQHRQPGCVGERGRAGRQGRAYGAAHRVPVGTGVGFAEDQVFEMAQRHGAATAVKAGRDGADADDDQRPAPLLRARGTFFAHADQLSIHRAYRYARAMARWSPTSRSEVTDSTSGAAELLRSLGISDPGNWMSIGCGPSGAVAATIGGVRFRWAPNRTASCRTSSCAPRTLAASGFTQWSSEPAARASRSSSCRWSMGSR